MPSHAQSMAVLQHPAASSSFSVAGDEDCAEPMSRTFQYRKVMKPLLERKRRARINKCLDELKDLMMHALQTEGENISKLEKADVLELTVKHLRKLKAANSLGVTPMVTYAQKFTGGYSSCATEVGRFLQAPGSGMNQSVSEALLARLANSVRTLEALPPSVIAMSAEVGRQAGHQQVQMPQSSPSIPQQMMPKPRYPSTSSEESDHNISPPSLKRTYQTAKTAYPPIMTSPTPSMVSPPPPKRSMTSPTPSMVSPPPPKRSRQSIEGMSPSSPLDYTRASLSKQQEEDGDSSDSSWRPW